MKQQPKTVKVSIRLQDDDAESLERIINIYAKLGVRLNTTEALRAAIHLALTQLSNMPLSYFADQEGK